MDGVRRALQVATRSAWIGALLTVGLAPLLAATPVPQIVIGNTPVPCTPPPILIEGDVHVPLAFRYGDLPIQADTDGEQVILRAPGNLVAHVPLTIHNGHAYYPIARACAEIQLGARWVERLQKMFIAPCVFSVRPEVGDRLLTLRVSSAYPVRYRVETLEDPPRLLVEIYEAHLYTDSTTIPVNTASVRQVRAAQYSFDPSIVRVVADLDGPPRYRILSTEVTTQIRVRVGVPKGTQDAELEQLLNAPDEEAAGAEVCGVEVEYADQENARILIRASAPVSGNVFRLDRPPRVAVDIPNTWLRAEPPVVAPGTPLVAGVRLGQFRDTITRIVVDLAEEAQYTLSQGTDPNTLVLNLRAAMNWVSHRGLIGLKVMLDPGHGGSQTGTTGLSGRKEKELNLDVALRVYALLEEAGALPDLTRRADQTVGLYARPAMANAKGVHLFLSIHANSNGQKVGRVRGVETYYGHRRSLPLALAVHRRLVRELQAPDRGVIYKPGFVVVRETKMPSILVEIGYMNHPEEDRLLGMPEYRQRVAEAIVRGIADYCGEPAPQLGLESEEETVAPRVQAVVLPLEVGGE